MTPFIRHPRYTTAAQSRGSPDGVRAGPGWVVAENAAGRRVVEMVEAVVGASVTPPERTP